MVPKSCVQLRGSRTDLLKPAAVESIFGSYKPVAMKIHSSDLEIMRCLLSDPRMPIEDIAKETSLSTKTVTRRLEKMTENHVLQFTIVVDLSSLQLTGYIEFAALINVHVSSHHDVVERMYREMEEYLLRWVRSNQSLRSEILAGLLATCRCTSIAV